MKPCEDFSKFQIGEDYGQDKNSAKLIQSHIDAKQFFCPEAFDLGIYGLKGDLESKILSIELKTETPSILEGRQMLLLLNNKRVDYLEDYKNP